MHVIEVVGDKGDVICIRNAGKGATSGGAEEATVTMREPSKERLNHEVEEEGGEGISLKGAAGNRDRRGHTVGGDKRGSSLGIEMAHYRYKIVGEAKSREDSRELAVVDRGISPFKVYVCDETIHVIGMGCFKSKLYMSYSAAARVALAKTLLEGGEDVIAFDKIAN